MRFEQRDLGWIINPELGAQAISAFRGSHFRDLDYLVNASLGQLTHGDAAYQDTSYADVAHTDTAHTDNPHTDSGYADGTTHNNVAYDDVSHDNVAYDDVAYDDVSYDDVASHTNHSDGDLFCFLLGTPVRTPDGYARIEDLEIGDEVLSYNEGTGAYEIDTVVDVLHSTSIWLQVHVGPEQTILCTASHPFLARDGWTVAGELDGKEVLTIAGWKYATVSPQPPKNPRSPVADRVVNLTTVPNHTFVIGYPGVVVHNKGTYGDHSDNTAHTDVAHTDVAHTDTSHTDILHTDTPHTDTNTYDDTYSDVAYGDVAYDDVSHTDAPHNDTAHVDTP